MKFDTTKKSNLTFNSVKMEIVDGPEETMEVIDLNNPSSLDLYGQSTSLNLSQPSNSFQTGTGAVIIQDHSPEKHPPPTQNSMYNASHKLLTNGKTI